MVAAAKARSESTPMNRTTLERTAENELVITRTFNGPPRIVFDAWTRPELVSRWWAPKSMGVSIISCDADVRVGGRYRYVLRHRTDEPFAFAGTYKDVTPHSRLVYTTIFVPGGADGDDESGAAVCTVTFEDRGEQTYLVSREVYPSKEVLDGVLATGMESGMRVTMDQLDELVASLR
jgi:uncharacterized protein YndB with AHSA1/START domain